MTNWSHNWCQGNTRLACIHTYSIPYKGLHGASHKGLSIVSASTLFPAHHIPVARRVCLCTPDTRVLMSPKQDLRIEDFRFRAVVGDVSERGAPFGNGYLDIFDCTNS